MRYVVLSQRSAPILSQGREGAGWGWLLGVVSLVHGTSWAARHSVFNLGGHTWPIDEIPSSVFAFVYSKVSCSIPGCMEVGTSGM